MRKFKRQGVRLVSVLLSLLMLTALFITPLSVNAETTEETTYTESETETGEATEITEPDSDEVTEPDSVEAIEPESVEENKADESGEPSKPANAKKRAKKDLYSTGSGENFYYKASGDSEVTSVSTFAEAWTAATASDEAVVGMLADVTVSSTLVVPENKSITLELNGHILDRDLMATSLTVGPENGNVITVSEGATLTIYGGTEADPEPAGAPTSRVWGYVAGDINEVSTVTDRGVITGGFSADNGGAIKIEQDASVNLYYTAVTGNRADNNGGGVALVGDNATLNMHDSEVSYNYADVAGGGIAVIDAANVTVTLDGGEFEDQTCTINNNTAVENGGGIAVLGSSTGCEITGDNVDQKSINNNLASGYNPDEGNVTGMGKGGGIYIASSQCTVEGFYIHDNEAFTDGGGVYVNAKRTTVKDCWIQANVTSEGKGGGIYNAKNTNTYYGVTVSSNNANRLYSPGYNDHVVQGDGIYASADITLAGKCSIFSNDALSTGQNLYLEVSSNYNTNTAYVDNHLTKGSKVYVTYGNETTGEHPARLTKNPGTYDVSYFEYDTNDYHFVFNPLSSDSEDNGHITRASGPKPERLTPHIYTQRTYTVSMISYNSQPVIQGIYEFLGEASGESEGLFYYSDGYFMDNPQTYNTHLATLSACMANAAMQSTMGGRGNYEGDYRDKSNNIRQMMSDMGCKDEDIFVNDNFTQIPTDQTIGDCIASKDLPNDEKLVIIAVRGGGYEAEWASNVTIGASGEAKGFSSAATTVFSDLEKYLEKKNIDGTDSKTKFWIAGYSRAGATSNLTAKRIVDAYDNSGSRTFAYPIEAPKGGVESAKKSGCNYDCIHNVVNYCDIVPWVAMKEVGFIRYGVDHFVPGSSTANEYTEGVPHDNYTEIVGSETYNAQKAKMLKQLRALNQDIEYEDRFRMATMNYIDMAVFSGDLISEKDSKHNLSVEEWLPKFWEKFVSWTFGDDAPREVYASKVYGGKTFQEAVADLMNLMMGDSKKGDKLTDALGGLLDKIGTWTLIKAYTNFLNTSINNPITNTSYDDFFKDVWKKVKKELKKDFSAEELDSLHDDFYVAIKTILKFVKKDYKKYNNEHLGTLLNNVGNLIMNHYAEVAVSWVRSYDSYYDVDKPMPVTLASTCKKAPSYPAIEVKNHLTGDVITYTRNNYDSDTQVIEVGLHDEIRLVPDDSSTKDTGEAFYYQFYKASSIDVRRVWHSFCYPIIFSDIEDGTADYNTSGREFSIYTFSSHYDKAASGALNEAGASAFYPTMLEYKFKVTDGNVIAVPEKYDEENDAYEYTTLLVDSDVSFSAVKPGEETAEDRWSFDEWNVYAYDAENVAPGNTPVAASQLTSKFGSGFNKNLELATVTLSSGDDSDYLFEPSYTKLPTVTFKVPDGYSGGDYTYKDLTLAYDTENPVSADITALTPGAPGAGKIWQFDGWNVYPYDSEDGADKLHPVSSSQYEALFGEDFDASKTKTTVTLLTQDAYLFEPSYTAIDGCTFTVPESYDSFADAYNYTEELVALNDSIQIKAMAPGLPTGSETWVFVRWNVYNSSGNKVSSNYASLFGDSFDVNSPITTVQNLTNGNYKFEPAYKLSNQDDFTYSFNAEYLTATVTGYIGNSNNITIPSTYTDDDGVTYVVNAIGVNAFKDNTSITSVDIPTSIRTIGNSAFENCTGLTGLTLPQDLRTIGANAFSGCTGLSGRLSIPNSVITLSDGAFHGCTGLTDVAIGNGITSIGPCSGNNVRTGTFSGCTGITSVTIPESVTSIGDRAFEGCSSLPSITIPSTVTGMGFSSFVGCSSLERVNISDLDSWCNIDHFGSSPFGGVGGARKNSDTYYDLYVGNELITDLTIPSNVTSIGHSAFAFCKSITNVTFHENVTSIGTAAFVGCTGLTSFTIPNTITNVGAYAFNKCTNLSSVTIGSGIETIPLQMFSYSGLTSVTIPDNVTAIGNRAFENCTKLRTVDTGDGVTSIGDSAFAVCTALNNPTIGESVESIGVSAFSNCTSLEKLVIPDNVTTLGGSVLQFSPNLYDLTINGELRVNYYGDNYYHETGIRYLTVTGNKINANSFEGYKDVYSLTIADTVESIAANSFKDSDNVKIMTVRGDGLFNYDYLPEEMVETLNVRGAGVNDNAFSHMTCLTSLNLADTVESIGEESFSYCTSLQNLTIPDNVESMDNRAFAECSALVNVTLSNNLTSLNVGVFYGCTSIEEITIPNKVETIGARAFAYCSSLESIEFPASVESIGSSSFQNCSSLPNVVIPSTVQSIGSAAFLNCTDMETAYVWGRNTTVDNEAFHGCPDLTIYAYDSSPADSEALRDGDIPFVPLLKTNLGGSYEDKPLTDTQTRLDDGNEFGLVQSTYCDMELLGAQLKKTDDRKDVRFVAVMNEGIVSEASVLHDVADYGFVVAKATSNSTATVGEDNIRSITLNAPNTVAFSCRNTSNKICGDYGIYNKPTKYKYVTLAINDVPADQSFVIRFYLKTKSGRVYYANYSTSYTGLVGSFTHIAAVSKGENTISFEDDWGDLTDFPDDD